MRHIHREVQWSWIQVPSNRCFVRKMCNYIYIYMGMDQYLYIPFLVGWTSIYQLFWCSPGVQGFDTLPYIWKVRDRIRMPNARSINQDVWVRQKMDPLIQNFQPLTLYIGINWLQFPSSLYFSQLSLEFVWLCFGTQLETSWNQVFFGPRPGRLCFNCGTKGLLERTASQGPLHFCGSKCTQFYALVPPAI